MGIVLPQKKQRWLFGKIFLIFLIFDTKTNCEGKEVELFFATKIVDETRM